MGSSLKSNPGNIECSVTPCAANSNAMNLKKLLYLEGQHSEKCCYLQYSRLILVPIKPALRIFRQSPIQSITMVKLNQHQNRSTNVKSVKSNVNCEDVGDAPSVQSPLAHIVVAPSLAAPVTSATPNTVPPISSATPLANVTPSLHEMTTVENAMTSAARIEFDFGWTRTSYQRTQTFRQSRIRIIEGKNM